MMTDPESNGAAPAWQAELEAYVAAMPEDERERMRASTLRALDRATQSRPLQVDELARLSALADYLAPRIERRLGATEGSLNQPVMLGLMAGYQLALGDSLPLEPDPFAE